MKGITVLGVDSHHYDKDTDKERGYNTIFAFEIDGVKLCHLGDLGRKLTDKQKSDIGKVDVLMIPVGGKFTLDKAAIDTVISQLAPRIVIPMHYKTSVMKDEDWPIATVDEFLKGKRADSIVKKETNKVSISKETLPKRQEIWVLEFKSKDAK
jgi:L-ascorbate metabolism protein UlaG (beta-lactamase superfamily)